MDNYIKFEPSKELLYDNDGKDYFYLFNKDKLMVELNGEKLLIPSRERLEEEKPEINHLQYLGAYEGINCYSGEITEAPSDNFDFVDLRTYSHGVNEDDFLVSAKALLLLDFVRANQRCGVCGNPMIMKVSDNDRAMLCSNCNNMVWPKTAPAIIVAVTKGDKLLLAHNRMFPEGIYSVPAGFVEAGETFEDCVRREIFEETGIKVHNIKYFGSQPWPFPNSYMIGFTAEYLEGELKPDNDEILDAKWFTKEEIPGKVRKSISISTKLIEWFMNK